jgi:hypothetical protein
MALDADGRSIIRNRPVNRECNRHPDNVASAGREMPLPASSATLCDVHVKTRKSINPNGRRFEVRRSASAPTRRAERPWLIGSGSLRQIDVR